MFVLVYVTQVNVAPTHFFLGAKYGFQSSRGVLPCILKTIRVCAAVISLTLG